MRLHISAGLKDLAGFFFFSMMLVAGESLAQEAPGVPVVVAEAERRTLAPVTLYPGAVISRNDARLSAEVDGRLEWVADVGDMIEAGAPAARMNDVLIRQNFAEEQANVAREKARLTFYEREVSRLTKLAKKSNAAQNQLDQSISDRTVAKSELTATQARVQYIEEQLARTELRAPFTGVVTERLMQAGEWADSGKTVLRLVDPAALEIQTRVPSETLAYVTRGSELKVTSRGEPASARVRTIVPIGDDQSRLYELRLTPSGAAWAAGRTVRVAVPTAAPREVVAVPRDALVLRRDGTRVFRISADGTAEAVSVTTGIAAGSFIEVTGGIQPGDRIVIRGGERLRPGQAVEAQPGKVQE